MQYEPVIGLEVHVELNTKSKMFCRCSADYFGKQPNTHTCPVCLGLPGSLPYINKQAIENCIKIGLALNCTVAEDSRFERKNYFYPDLSKGYQISQYRWPLCVNGWLLVADSEGKEKKIRINRVHQEEDTGKLMHLNENTAIDFNRSGVPLVEIVTEPDFHDIDAVVDYAKKLQQIFRYLGVSNADMERGDMRLEANVSVRPKGHEELPDYRIELKNINSFRFMKAAIEYEIERQSKALENGEKLSQETRGWNEDKKITYLQRSKEEAHDYRYFPDPDLPGLRMKNLELRVKQETPELPQQKSERYVKEFGLTAAQAKTLSDDKDTAAYFEQSLSIAVTEGVSAIDVANMIINKKPDPTKIKPADIVEEIKSRKAGVVEDEEQLGYWAADAVAENPKAVEDYKNGKEAALQMMIGNVMKKSQGKANAGKVKEILQRLLKG